MWIIGGESIEQKNSLPFRTNKKSQTKTDTKSAK